MISASTDVPDKLLLSAREAAAALSISERTLWAHSQPRGDIPVVRLGGRVLYPVDGLRDFVERQKGANAS